MSERFVNSDIRDLLKALKAWRKACQKVRQAVPDPATAEAQAQAAERKVIEVLRRPGVTEAIAHLLQTMPAAIAQSNQPFQQQFARDADAILFQEMQLIHLLQVRSRDLDDTLQLALQPADSEGDLETVLPDSSDLIRSFKELHNATVSQLAATRSEPRKIKKQRKRQITLGVTFTALGIALLAANAQIDDVSAPYSYILGGNALLQAMRDLIGRAPEEQ